MGDADALEELGIRRTLAQYCHHCDDGDFDRLVALFAPDAVVVYGTTQAHGHAQLRAFFVERQGLPGQRGKHLTLNSVVDVDRDRARALSDFVVLGVVDGSLTPVYGGRYRDDLVRREGGWRFARRQIVRMDAPAG